MWCLPSGAVCYTGACYKPFVAMEAFL